MSDLISRAELFNRLATVKDMGEAYAVIQGMPTVGPEDRWKWMSCKELLPEVGGEYLVTLTDTDGVWVSTAIWDTTFGGRWQDIFPYDGYCDIDNVIAWKVLPAPYKEE